MPNSINRRDFLKLLALLPPAIYLPPQISRLAAQNTNAPNILVLVFDTWSGSNVSLYGYPRQTTPNLERLAEKAIVYHNHYAGGHFTTTGTATLLTGVHPWHHELYSPNYELNTFYRRKNIFGMLPDYHRLAYTHNPWANKILLNMAGQIDTLKPRGDLYISHDIVDKIFPQDYDIASVAWIRTMETVENGFANSAFFSRLWTAYTTMRQRNLAENFPYGLPKMSETNTFLLEDAVEWLAKHIQTAPTPSLTYFHLLPPHHPYNTREDFYNAFASDGYAPVKKPEHFFSDGISYEENSESRREYDEYILYVDAEIGHFFSLLENSPQADNTWVVLTSDHGEIFERGLKNHAKPSMYDPLVKVPLMIFPPGQKERIDVHSPTSMIDILPTMLTIANQGVPGWAEGMLLPPFNQTYPADRLVYVMDAKYNQIGQPYTNGSFMLRRENYKLIHHFGSEGMYIPLQGASITELYDLSTDPEELTNLFDDNNPTAIALLHELKAKLRSMDLLK